MGELPETQHHSKRLEKGSTAHCLRRSLRWINYFTILGSVLSMAAVLIIRHNPTWAGWVFLALGGLTVISGILGCISSEGCFSLHFLTLGLSLGGLGAASLALFIKRKLVKQHLKSELSDYHTQVLMKLDASLCLALLCMQIIILVLAFTLRKCYYVDYYEDIENRSLRRKRNLAKVQEESELRAVVHERSQANELCTKMKQKYGRYTQEGEFDSIK